MILNMISILSAVSSCNQQQWTWNWNSTLLFQLNESVQGSTWTGSCFHIKTCMMFACNAVKINQLTSSAACLRAIGHASLISFTGKPSNIRPAKSTSGWFFVANVWNTSCSTTKNRILRAQFELHSRIWWYFETNVHKVLWHNFEEFY